MADRMLFIGWGTPVRGMEARGLEVLGDALGLLGRMQQEGRVESFDFTLLTPNGSLNGYVEVHGSSEQINALRDDEEFIRSRVGGARARMGRSGEAPTCKKRAAGRQAVTAREESGIPTPRLQDACASEPTARSWIATSSATTSIPPLRAAARPRRS